MKTLNNYINEKLIIDTNVRNKRKDRNYNYHPTTKQELIDIIKEHTKGKKSGQRIDLNDIDVWEINDMSNLFEYTYSYEFDVSQWEVDNVTNMDKLFINASYLNCDLSDWNVSNVKSMKHMFYWCNSFTGQGLDKWDTRSLENMVGIFSKCSKLDVDLSNWNTSKVENMSFAFKGCSFTSKKLKESIKNWDVSKCKKFRETFSGSSSFSGVDLSNWNMSNAIDITSMFRGCDEFNCDLSNWNTRNLQYMDNVFYGCKKINFDISKWNVRKVKSMICAFYDCTNLDCNLDNWKLNKDCVINGLFNNSKFELDEKIPTWYEK